VKSNKNCNLENLEENNLYSILNIKENATKEEIKKSFRNLSKIYHPDKGGTTEEFLKIYKSYQILINDTCKSFYDQFSIESFSLIELILKEEDHIID